MSTMEKPLLAQSPHVGRQREAPVYQRHAFEWSRHPEGRRRDRHGQATYWRSPPVNAGWFQRPYPYHLDYYRMRYGGSYAPYFGNLYGPPQVVTAPPYYGPYYGGFGYGAPDVYDQHLAVPLAPPAEPSAPAANEALPAPQQ